MWHLDFLVVNLSCKTYISTGSVGKLCWSSRILLARITNVENSGKNGKDKYVESVSHCSLCQLTFYAMCLVISLSPLTWLGIQCLQPAGGPPDILSDNTVRATHTKVEPKVEISNAFPSIVFVSINKMTSPVTLLIFYLYSLALSLWQSLYSIKKN